MKTAAIALLVLSVARFAAADVRTIDGRIEATKSTEDEAEVRRWLTGLDAAPLFPTSHLEANTEYYVRVRARVKPHGSLIVWPWDSGLVSTNVNFTLIP